MSKGMQTMMYVDENVSSISQAREYEHRAEKYKNDLKGELWGLVMATPKDIVAEGDPIDVLRERFDDIWESLWDAFVDEYKYGAIADDAEFVENSLVKKQWTREEEERKEIEKETKIRSKFFNKYKDVLNPFNFDDIRIYEKWSDGKLELGEILTKEERDNIIKDLNEKEQELFRERVKELEKHE